jgi:hypothetical protein
MIGVTRVFATEYYSGDRVPSDSESDDDDEDPYYAMEMAAIDRAEGWR